MRTSTKRFLIPLALILPFWHSIASASIVGSWYLSELPTATVPPSAGGSVVITFMPNGQFVYGQDGDSTVDPNGNDGMEWGTYRHDGSTLSWDVGLDTNGQWGLKNDATDNIGSAAATVSGDTLRLFSRDFSRVGSNSIAGSWKVDGLPDDQSVVLTFLDSGKFMLVHGNNPSDLVSPAGIEYGSYRWDSASGDLDIVSLPVDTNGDAGLSHLEIVSLTILGDTMLLELRDEVISLTRVATGTSLPGGFCQGGYVYRENRVDAPEHIELRDDAMSLGCESIDTSPDAVVTARNVVSGEIVELQRFGLNEYFATTSYSVDNARGGWVVIVRRESGELSGSGFIRAFTLGEGTAALPGVQNMRVTGWPPVIQWTAPPALQDANDGNVDIFRVRLFNVTHGQSRLIDFKFSDLASNSYAIPPATIDKNGIYNAQVLVEGFNPFNRSRTYLDFAVTQAQSDDQASRGAAISAILGILTDD